jgi:thiol-disulfide isomerase/thioredoxin
MMAKTIIDFWADWCGPCKVIAPVLDMVEAAGNVTVTRYDTETQEGGEKALKLLVSSLPTVILMEDGREVGRLTGASGETLMGIKWFAGL